MSERLDKFMLDKKLVLTRSQARMLIKQGDVFVNAKLITKPGHLVKDTDEIKIKEGKLYVSRGAYKLTRALDYFELDIKDMVVMDCGASTGGFTQVCLEHGVKKIYALDVGHDQLAAVLKAEKRVINQEGINLKYPFELAELCDGFVMDLSFISIKLVIQNIKANLKACAFGVLLIKPQFEVGKEKIGKGGLVSSNDALLCAKEIKSWLCKEFSFVSDFVESPIKGKSGNQEFLIFVRS